MTAWRRTLPIYWLIGFSLIVLEFRDGGHILGQIG